MKENHRFVAELDDKSSTLWRFMDFTKYVAMLHRRALFFTRADQLPDPFEGLYTRRHYRLRPQEASGTDSRLRQRVCLSCWHQNEHESAAMWRIYLNSEDGVAIRSTVGRLRDALAGADEPLHVGRVRYLDYESEIIPDAHQLAPFFCKRKSFEYEREVRVLWCAEQPVEDTGRYVKADLEALVGEVVVSPAAEPWFGDLVMSVTEKYGYELKVRASSMLDNPADERDRVTE